MSASDKKKQRKAQLQDGLTQRQIAEMNEAKAAQQKKRIYTAIGVVCAVAAAALLVWNTHFWEKGATAATVDGQEYTVGDLQYYYAQARNTEYSMYTTYTSLGLSYSYDPMVGDGEQWYNEAEGLTYADYFRQTALDSLGQVAALTGAAAAEGYTLSAEGQADIEKTFEEIDQVCAQYNLTRASYFAQTYGDQVDEALFTKHLTNATLAVEYQQYHQENISYADEDLAAYYDENPDLLDSYDFRLFYIDGTAPNPVDENGEALVDENGNTVTATAEEQAIAMQAAQASAQAAVNEIEAAEDREAAFLEAAPKYVAESDREAYTDETYSLATGILGNVLTRNGSSYATWLMDSARKEGDVTSVETSGGYYVVLFLDRYLGEESTVDIRHILILADTTDSTETDENGYPVPTQEALDAAKAEAEALLAEWKDGEATADSFGALAVEHSDDPGSSSAGGEYTYVEQGTMFDGFDQWIFDPARQSGDTGLVENPQSGQQGWHVIYFDQMQEPAWKGVAIENKQTEDQSVWLEELIASVTVTEAEGMKYVGDESTAAPTPSESPASSEAPATESPEA